MAGKAKYCAFNTCIRVVPNKVMKPLAKISFFSFFRILLFEEKAKAAERPTGVAPKRDLSSLP